MKGLNLGNHDGQILGIIRFQTKREVFQGHSKRHGLIALLILVFFGFIALRLFRLLLNLPRFLAIRVLALYVDQFVTVFDEADRCRIAAGGGAELLNDASKVGATLLEDRAF